MTDDAGLVVSLQYPGVAPILNGRTNQQSVIVDIPRATPTVCHNYDVSRSFSPGLLRPHALDSEPHLWVTLVDSSLVEIFINVK